MLVYLLTKQHQEFEKTVALTQIQLDPKKAPEAIKSYHKALFPWMEKQDDTDKKDHSKLLLDEIRRGPLVVTPQITKPLRSRMNTKILDADSARKAKHQIMNKLGSVVPR